MGPPSPRAGSRPARADVGVIAKPKSSSPLSLMDELRQGSKPLRRYQCNCRCEECICSDHQVNPDDSGTDVTLAEICGRLQSTLGVPDLEATFRETGGDEELRRRISNASFPC